MSKDIIIFGAGGLAREVSALLYNINHHAPKGEKIYNILAYAVTDGNHKRGLGMLPIYEFNRELFEREFKDLHFAIGIGTPSVRKEVFEACCVSAPEAQRGAGLEGCPFVSEFRFPNIFHPSVEDFGEVLWTGPGNIFQAGNIFTTNIHIGRFNYFNLACTFGHDVVIGDFNVINPGCNISGGVVIGNECLIGTGATILQGLTIGDRATVGAGAVVTKDVPEGETWVGVPARQVKRPEACKDYGKCPPFWPLSGDTRECPCEEFELEIKGDKEIGK